VVSSALGSFVLGVSPLGGSAGAPPAPLSANVFLVPFIPATPQSLQISINGVTYTMKVRFCVPANCWMLDLSDVSGNNPILQGIPLITGTDLLSQFAYLGLGFSLLVQSNNDPTAVPTFASLGLTGNLYVLTAQ
jgi:hypothetical protein